ncbi:MAG: hypothetical protein ACAI25_07495, partial [Planctomycetota bacterium]
SILQSSDVNAVLAGTVAVAALATGISEDLGVRRGGSASVTVYIIDPTTRKTLHVVTGTDDRGRRP